MASVLDKIVVAILKHKDEKTLFKIDKSWLDKHELRRFRYVTDYYKEHSELVSLRDYCRRFDVDEHEGDSRPTLYLRELRDRHIFAEISEEVPLMLRRAKNNPQKVLDDLAELVSKLNTSEDISNESMYSDEAEARLEEYAERVRTGGISYIRFGHPVLDDLMYGLRKTDLVTFGGRAGVKKTFLLCHLAIIIEKFLPPEFGDILFVTNEVPASEIKERMDAMRFFLPYGKFLAGKLSRAEHRRYINGVEDLIEAGSRIRVIENCTRLEDLRFKVKMYNPSLILLDGSYLMEPQSTRPEWEKVTLITRGLKYITNHDKVPIINTTQLKRGSGKNEKSTSFDAQDDFAFSNSYSQDSDIAFRMYADKEMIFRDEVGLQVAKGRRIAPGATPKFYCPMTTMEFDFMPDDEEAVHEQAEEEVHY